MRSRSPLIIIGVVILLLAAVAGLFWVNYQYSANERGGNDFAVYWNSARTVLFDGATPYGELASLRSQFTIYGIADKQDAPPFKLDLPFHIETLLLPLALFKEFQIARAFWMTLLEVALVVTVFLMLRVLRWIPDNVVGGSIIIFSIFIVYGLWAIIQGNAIILIGLFISGALLALRDEHDEVAGILLGLATFKFLSTGFFLIFILLWALFRGRKRIFLPFIMTFLILLLVSFFFYPNWFTPYARAIFANLKYGNWLSPAVIFQQEFPFIGERLGWAVSILFGVILLVEWWLVRRKEFSRMIWTGALTLSITPLLGIPTYPQNYIVLIIPLVVSLSIVSDRWKASQIYLIPGLLFVLFLVFWGITIFSTDAKTALFFPFPLLVVILLYWVRWWVVSGPRG